MQAGKGRKYGVSISSGHGLWVRGAKSFLDEAAEARAAVIRAAKELKRAGVETYQIHEDRARNQRDNVNAIINAHNALDRAVDVSVHFNAAGGGPRKAGIGTETLYRAGDGKTRELAARLSAAITGASGLVLRRGDGTWGRSDLGFLNRTERPAVLIEACFVDSETDARLYGEHSGAIWKAVAETLAKWLAENGA